jgi:hypothetical protein
MQEDLLLSRCRFLVDVHFWPPRREMDPVGWLANFDARERVLAQYLLQGTIYLSSPVTEQMFTSAFHSLCPAVVQLASTANRRDVARLWSDFLRDVRIVRVPGEISSDADSGYIFSRLSRDKIGVDETHLYSVDVLAREILQGVHQPVVFVDDFVGSGEQFVTMWHEHMIVEGKATSLSELFRDHPDITPRYCGVVGTSYGLSRIRRACPGVELHFANELGDEYSSLHPQSRIWPDGLQAEGSTFIQDVSQRLGLPEWRGFHHLGLTLAFEHKVPDATIPLLTARNPQWRPLIN